MKFTSWNLWHGCKKLSPGCAHCYVYRGDAWRDRDASEVKKNLCFDLPVMEIFNSPEYATKFMVDKDAVNDVFNTYKFTICRAITIFGITDMSLESVADNKTKISIVINNAHGQTTSNSILAGMVDDYLLVLGKVLNGETIQQVKATTNTSGCATVIAVVVMLGSIAVGCAII